MSKVQTPNKTELKSTRLYSVKSSNSNFGLYPNKGNDDLCHDLIDLRNESAQTLDNLFSQKLKLLFLMSKTIKNFDPTSNANFNMDLDLTQLESARSNPIPIVFTEHDKVLLKEQDGILNQLRFKRVANPNHHQLRAASNGASANITHVDDSASGGEDSEFEEQDPIDNYINKVHPLSQLK